MCRRSVGCSQEHIMSDCNIDVVYDVTGANGCIFGVSDLQPGSAAPTAAIQGPSGTVTWRFLPARCRVEFFHVQHILVYGDQNIFLPNSVLVVALGWGGRQLGESMHVQVSCVVLLLQTKMKCWVNTFAFLFLWSYMMIQAAETCCIG